METFNVFYFHTNGFIPSDRLRAVRVISDESGRCRDIDIVTVRLSQILLYNLQCAMVLVALISTCQKVGILQARISIQSCTVNMLQAKQERRVGSPFIRCTSLT